MNTEKRGNYEPASIITYIINFVKMMKIAVIIRKLNVSGGAQRIALNVVSRLKAMGHDVTLYTFIVDREKCFPELLQQFEIVELPARCKRTTGGLLGFLEEDRMARSLAYLIKRDTEILYPDDGPAHHVAYYYKKYIRNIPSVWNMNELPTMRWPLGLLSIAENRAFHAIPWRPLWLKKGMILIKTLYERRFIRAQDAIIVFDKFHQMMLRRYAKSESSIIPSGVDDLLPPILSKRPPVRGERLNLLSSGIFLSYRRFEDAIETLAILIEHGYDAYLTILGDYSTDQKYHEKLKELCQNRRVENRVVFWGRYSDVELQKFFAESHIFIYPHLQSQGIAVNEAIVSGLPTIVTPLAGTYETLQDSVHAVFAEARNPASIAEAVMRLVRSPDLYQRIGKDGSKHMKKHFTWKRQGQEVAGLMQRVVEGY